MSLTLRDPSTCLYDQISLGEVMLRLDPGEGERLRIARGLPAGGFGIKMRDYFGKPNGFAGQLAA